MIGKDKKKKFSSSVNVAILTFFSRVFGYLRDLTITFFFGANTLTDSFYVAFRIPNLFRRLVAEGTLSSTLVPFFTKYVNSKDENSFKKFRSEVFSILILVLIFFTLLFFFFSKEIVSLFAFGFSEDQLELSSNLLKRMSPFLFFISLSAFNMGLLNSKGKFFAPAFSPVMFNLAIILTLFTCYFFLELTIYSLSYAVLLGAIAQFLIQLPFISHNHLNYKFSLETFLSEETKAVIKVLIPQVVGLGVYNLNILINTQFASFMEDGSVTYLYLAERLLELPLGVFAVSIATISLTQLSEFSNNKNLMKMTKYLNDRMAFLYFLLCPCCIVFLFWGDSICDLLYVRGEFTLSDSYFTYKALIAYSVGLIFVGGVRLLTQAFFAIKDTATPVKLAIINLILNALLCYFFSIILNFGFIGLALSSSISSIVLFLSLTYSLRKNKINLKFNLLIKFLVFIFFSFIALLISNYIIETLIFKSSIVTLFLKFICFAVFYFLFSYLTKMKELKLIKE